MASSCVTQVSASLVGIKTLSFPSSSRKSSSVKLCQIKSGMWGSSLNLKASVRSPLIRRQRKISVCEAEATSTSETDIEVEVLASTQEEEEEEKKEENGGEEEIEPEVEVVQTLEPAKTGKVKKTKGLKNIMQTLHQRAVEAASEGRNIPDLRTGDIVQLRVEVPQNKKRISLLRGIVIAKHNAGIHTTFRIRRVIAGVGVEMVFPIYSPNIKEIKVVNSRKVRRAKLYYLRDKLARLSTV